MTTVYLVRHSKPFRELEGETKTNDSLQLINEKYPLGIEGEKLAERVAGGAEFGNIDVVWASNYVRAISTAKYFAGRNNTKVNIDDRFGERLQGIIVWDELPKDFHEKQFFDENYKFRDGESRKEVALRMREALFEVIKKNKGKRIVIVSHNAAITFLLMSLCEITRKNAENVFVFKNKVVYSGNLNFCETFKLEFDDKPALQSMTHIDT